MKHFFFIMLALTLSLAVLSPWVAAEELRVGVLADGSSDYWTAFRNEAQAEAKALGLQLDFRVPAPPTTSKQEELAQKMIESGVQVLAICPIRPSKQVDLINSLSESLPVITFLKDVPGSERRLFIGRDNGEIGRLLADLVKNNLPDGLKIQVLSDSEEQGAGAERLAAFREELDDYVIVDQVLEDKGDRMLGWANVVDSLDSRPEIAAFVGMQDYHGPSILRAVLEKGRGKWVRVLSWGSDETTLKGLAEGTVQGLVVDQAQGAAAVVLKALATLTNQDADGSTEIETGVTPVTVIRTEASQSAEEMMNALQVQLPWMSETNAPAPESGGTGKNQAD